LKNKIMSYYEHGRSLEQVQSQKTHAAGAGEDAKHWSYLLRTGGAGRADAEEKNFMVFNDESLGCRCLLIEGTAGQFEDPVAVVAVEVMMMPLARALEKRTM
jgi:hypothetical protein